MKVSIIIPVYNVASFIERCLLSVLNQTWQDLEIVLVNDCTPDNSMDIVNHVLDTHPRKSIVKICTHEKNGGIAAARNTGMKGATGEYLYFMDSDDYISLNCIEILVSKVEQYNVDIVVGNFEIVGSAHTVPSKLAFKGLLNSNSAVIDSYAKDQWPVMPWNKLVRRDLLISENLFFEESIVHEDDLWSFLLICKAKSAYAVCKPTYYYVLHQNSFMGKVSFRKLESRIKIIEIIFDFIVSQHSLKHNPSIYNFYEKLKAKYFDRIIYFSKDKKFHYKAYCIFREKKYISPLKALIKLSPNIKLIFRNVHYLLPSRFGYYYFKCFVRTSYYMLVLPIKIRKWFRMN